MHYQYQQLSGGATETLVNNLVDENEKEKKLDITVVSIYEEEAFQKSKEYSNTEFIYINEGKYEGEKDLEFKSTNQKLADYVDSIYDALKDRHFDCVVMEGGYLQEYKKVLTLFPKNRSAAHIHGIYKVDEVVNNLYGYFFVISDYVGQVVKSTNLVSDDRIKTIYNGIKIENFKKEISVEEKLELRKKYGIAEDENVVLFCGRTVQRKGIKELISGFKKIKNLNKTKLLIVGNSNFGEEVITDYDRELRSEAESIKDRIIFTGFIHNENLYKIYNIADLAIFPTIDEEPFGLVVVEAMAAGCPVILTKSGAFPEIAADTNIPLLNKDNRLIDEITQSLDEFLDNKDLRKMISEQEKEKVNQYSNNTFYNNFVQLVVEICNEN